METAEALARYAEAFERLTLVGLSDLRSLCHADVAFVDPFNDVRGVDRFIAVFKHMYATLDDPRFVVLDRALGYAGHGRTGYLKWRMTGRTKSGAFEVDIVGMSEVSFDEAGLATRHVDHWDAASQLYARLPLVGGPIRWLGRRFALDERRF